MAAPEEQMECPIRTAIVTATYDACRDGGAGSGHALTTQVEQFLAGSWKIPRVYGSRAERKSAAARRWSGRTSVALSRDSHQSARA